MRRPARPSVVAVAVAAVGLLIGFDGPSWAANSSHHHQIATHQIKNGAVTRAKIAPHAVTGSRLARDSVTSSNVLDGSLTPSDLAPDSFLPADGTATNSQSLGGHPASDFVQGTGLMQSNSISVGEGHSSDVILGTGIGEIRGDCTLAGVPTMTFIAQVAPINLIDTATTNGVSATDLQTHNGLNVGSSYQVPNTNGHPQSVTFQVRYTADGVDHFATAWLSDQFVSGPDECLFIGQGITTG